MTYVKSVAPACLILLASALAATCTRQPDAAKRAYLESGNKYFAEKKYKEAILEYRNAVQQDPRFGEARYKLAETYIRVNDTVGASREYLRAADLMPANSEAQLKAGQMLLLARRFEDAKTRADQILVNDPRSVQAQILRGAALTGLSDLDDAVAQIEEAIEIDPGRSATYEDLGALRLAKGDQDAAEEAFTTAVHLDGKSVRARLALAIFYLSTKQAAKAEDALERTLDIDSSNLLANRALALICLSSHRAADAEGYLKTVSDISKTAASRLALAGYYILMNRTSDAVRILNMVDVTDRPGFAAAQSRLAAIEYAEGKTREAHDRVDAIVARQPKQPTALLLKARFLLAERMLDSAVAQTRAAVEADPNSAPAQFLLGKLYGATNQPDAATKAFNEALRLNPHAAAAHIELSRLQLANGNVDASIESARQAVTDQPNNPYARLQLGRGLIALHKTSEAEHELMTLLQGYPDASVVHTQLGFLNLAKGDRRAAKRSFERALTLDDHSLETLSGLVTVDLGEKNNAEAIARVEAKLKQVPDDVGLLQLAGATYAASRQPGRAEGALGRAIQIDPANLQAHSMLGHLFLSERKFDEAKAEFGVLATSRPGTPISIGGQTMVAIVLEAQNRPEEAQRLYEQILAAAPRAMEAANNLAWLYVTGGSNLDVALSLAQSAVEQAPDRPEFNDTLGWIYYKKDLPTASIAILWHSVEKDPTNPIYHYHLGLAYAKSGDRARAKPCLEKALALEPDFEGSTDARHVLASMKD